MNLNQEASEGVVEWTELKNWYFHNDATKCNELKNWYFHNDATKCTN